MTFTYRLRGRVLLAPSEGSSSIWSGVVCRALNRMISGTYAIAQERFSDS